MHFHELFRKLTCHRLDLGFFYKIFLAPLVHLMNSVLKNVLSGAGVSIEGLLAYPAAGESMRECRDT